MRLPSLRHARRHFASVAPVQQSIIEKIVQKYAVGLPSGKMVRAGDYVTIRPQHVMTHDNTGPVITKCVKRTNRTAHQTFLSVVFQIPHDRR